MLYERWRQVARLYRDETALRDLASGRSWTFAQLAAASERADDPGGRWIFPQGQGAEFILKVLQGWRHNRTVCPLEAGQVAPDPSADLPSQIIHLKLTSATTGRPKLIAFTADQLAADAENIVLSMGLQKQWPNLGVVSLAHSYGFSNLVLPLLLHGIPLFLLEAPLPELVRRAADTAVTLAAVPALWRAWHDAASIPTNVRLAISAGAPLPLQLEQSVYSQGGLKIHNFYGSSECGGIAYDRSNSPRAEAGCVGNALANVQLSVAGDGCLEVRGRSVGQGYWPTTDESLADGVFHTSDLATLADGLVYLRGRASDQINVAGRKVSPETIEKMLMTHPEVRECLVFGVPSPDANRVEEIVACVVPRRKVPLETLKQFLLEHLPAWQVPREWRMLDSLGVNSRGKISRADWRKRIQAELESSST